MTGKILLLILAAAAAATATAGVVRAGWTTRSAAGTPGRPEAGAVATSSPAARPRIIVHKDPNCGCCKSWVDHMRTNGFEVVNADGSNLDSVKKALGVPPPLAACHTAEVDGYIVEGHVPADVVKRLLRERPKVAGLAVAGMPAGSPGMEVGYTEPYAVIAFTKQGRTSTFAKR